MEVRMERRGGALLAVPEGRIDSATARDFESKMKAAIQDEDRAVVVNLSQLSYISSAGLRAVLVIAKACGGAMRALRSARFPIPFGRSSSSPVSTRSSRFTVPRSKRSTQSGLTAGQTPFPCWRRPGRGPMQGRAAWARCRKRRGKL